jgi:hypothetical protein
MLTRLQNDGLRSPKVIAQLRVKFGKSYDAFLYFEKHLDAKNGIFKLSSDFSNEILINLFLNDNDKMYARLK